MKSDSGESYKSPVFDVVSDTDSLAAASSSGASGPTPSATPASPPSPLQPGSIAPAAAIQSQQPTLAASSAPSPTTHLQPIGPIVPPSFGSSITSLTNYPSAAPIPIQTITPAEAAASAARKTGHVIAAAVAIPLGLIAFAALAGAASCLVLKRKGPNAGSKPASSSSANTLVDDGLTKLPSRTSSNASLSSLASSTEKPYSSVPEYQKAPPIHQMPSYLMQPHLAQSAPYMSQAQADSMMAGLTAQQQAYWTPGHQTPSYFMNPNFASPHSSMLPQQPMHYMPINASFMPTPSGPGTFIPPNAHTAPPSIYTPQPSHPPARPAFSRTLTPAFAHSLADAKRMENVVPVPNNAQSTAQVPSLRSTPPLPISVPPAALFPGAVPVLQRQQQQQGQTPPTAALVHAAAAPGSGDQLTPPASTDSQQQYHLTMQHVLNSYMDQQREIQYRDKPMPALPTD